MRSILLVVLLFLPVCAGCSKGEKGGPMAGVKVAAPRGEMARDAMAPGAPDQAGFVAHQNEAPPQPGGQVEKKPKVDQPRKIKYTADVSIIVEDFSKAWEELKSVIKEAKAIKSQEEINDTEGSQRKGTWRLRVPVAQFETFRDAVLKLGKSERNTLNSQDMTAEFYDLEAHIKNKQAEREAVRKLLEKTGDRDLRQFFEVKKELDTITDYINRQEGQLRLWTNLTDLTTVTLNLRERQKLAGEQKPDDRPTATFGARAGTSWSRSWDLFVSFWEGVAIIAIFVAPWLVILLAFVGVFWVIVRRLTRSSDAPVVLEVVDAKK